MSTTDPAIAIPRHPDGRVDWGTFFRSLSVGQCFVVPVALRMPLLVACVQAGARVVTRVKDGICTCAVIALPERPAGPWPVRDLPPARNPAAWDAFFSSLSGNEVFSIPSTRRAIFQSAARVRGVEFFSHLHPSDPQLVVIHIRDLSGALRRSMLRDFKTLSFARLRALHTAAAKQGLFLPR